MTRIYIVIPGSVTGDLWHVAAAQILSSKYDKTIPPLVAVVAVTASNANDTNNDKLRKDDEVQKGKVTFNYLRSIGLKVMLLKLVGTNAGTPMIEQILHSQPSAWYDQAYDVQGVDHGELARLDFDHLIGRDEIKVAKADLDPNGRQIEQPFPKLQPFPKTLENNRVLQLKTATTIAMNLLSHKSTRKERHDFLAVRMHSSLADGDPDPHSEYKQLAVNKFKDLELLVSNMKKDKGWGGIILENYRKGHVNGGTDTSKQLSEELERLANASKLGVIAIPATATEDGYREVKSRYKESTAIFDLYNKTGTRDGKPFQWIDTPWPGLDTQAQAYFWHQVARSGLIQGLVGGRSGSVDIAAFCGVKTLFWDEPWIDYACSGEGVDGWRQRSPNNDMEAIAQIPQCLRSQQLMAIMGTVAPVRTKDRALYVWGKLQVNEDVFKGDITQCTTQPPTATKLEDWNLVGDRPRRLAFD